MADTTFAVDTVRVLVVEDDPNNRIVITRLLALAGVKQDRIFEMEGDPASFLEGNEVDVVLLDIQLPGKDGYSILADLRADPRYSGLRIIALTANVMRHDIERAKGAGFDGFIGKPIDGRRFGEVFKRILAGEAVWTVN
jgi:two-component system cell cycle response regulator DivK